MHMNTYPEQLWRWKSFYYRLAFTRQTEKKIENLLLCFLLSLKTFPVAIFMYWNFHIIHKFLFCCFSLSKLCISFCFTLAFDFPSVYNFNPISLLHAVRLKAFRQKITQRSAFNFSFYFVFRIGFFTHKTKSHKICNQQYEVKCRTQLNKNGEKFCNEEKMRWNYVFASVWVRENCERKSKEREMKRELVHKHKCFTWRFDVFTMELIFPPKNIFQHHWTLNRT